MVNYGSLQLPAMAPRPRRSNTTLLVGVTSAAVLALTAMVAYHGSMGISVLKQKNNLVIARDYSNRPIAVPKTAVNTEAGTSASVSSPFENDAMDKAPMQQLAQQKGKWVYDWSGESVPVPKTAVNFQKGTRALPSGEFANDAMDKAPTQALHWKGSWVRDFSGQKIAVPSTHVNYDAGTVVSPRSEFDHLAHDKATTTQQLASGDARDTRPMTEYPTSCVGDVCGDEVLDNGLFDNPQVDVAHAACDKDTDPECQTSVDPLLDKQTRGGTLLSFSAQKAREDMAAFFAAEERRPARHVSTRQAVSKPAHGESTAAADKELDRYFAKQQKLAAAPRAARQPAKAAATKREEAAPKFGLSGAKAREDAAAFFAKQQKLQAAEGGEVEATKADVKHVGGVAADETLDHPLWQSTDQTVDSVQVPGAKADCGDDMDCQSSRSPLLYAAKRTTGLSTNAADGDLDAYFAQQAKLAGTPQAPHPAAKPSPSKLRRKGAGTKYGLSGAAARREAAAYFAAQKQQLAVYSVGAMDDSGIEVGKAQGVDALLPETVFGENPAPPGETIDEVNMAIQDQRNEGYTNGEAQPAEDIVIP